MALATDYPTIWNLRSSNELAAQGLVSELGLHPVVASLLVQRGYAEPADASTFLNPSLDHLTRPEELPDFEKAKAAILGAKERGEKIYIHGDYDVDGVTSAAILYRFLKKTGFEVEGHVPHRENEGYGIHIDTIHRAKASGADLILTCDCGTSSHAQLEAAYELGMKVVVTDHHESPETLPRAEAVVNPKRRDYSGPAGEMSGAGIAFLFCAGLAPELGIKPEVFYRHFLDLAVMGTVADVMPLRDNNRIIARHGLTALKASQKHGVQALLSVSNLSDPTAKLTTRHIGFQLGPRINAVGRIDDADMAFRLLTTDDAKEAFDLANFLNQKNTERRELQDVLVEEACAKILADGLDQKFAIVVAGENWQKGLVGIAAGKVVERFRRPAFVLGIHGDIASGSARSIPAFNLFEAIEVNRPLLIKGGGHAAAAGVSLDLVNLEAFADAMDSFASARLKPEDFQPTLTIDQELDLSQSSLELAQQLSTLEPFGESNPEPLFQSTGVRLAACTPTRNPIHARLTLETESGQRQAMAFGIGEQVAELPLQSEIDLVYTIEEDRFNNRPQLKLIVKDLRLSD